MTRLSWDDYFMLNAELISSRSTCPRASVGAIIVKDNQLIASGYNGSTSGDDHCCDVGCKLDKKGQHCIRTVHAGATIYVTHFPCVLCSKLIIQAGISKVVYNIPYKIDPYAKELLLQAGVKVLQKSLSLVEFVNDEEEKEEEKGE